MSLNTYAARSAEPFRVTFTAAAATPYQLWLRMRARADSYANDSVWVQFSDALNAAGAPVYRIGTPTGCR